MKNYVALGDLVLDIYHNTTKEECGYYVGGSAWNDLINISNLDPKARCFCIATCGNDWAGDFIIQELNELGIDTVNVTRLNKQTKRFNIVVNGEQTKSQLECPQCKQTIWYSDSKLPKSMPKDYRLISKGIVIIDSLKKNILELAKSFCKEGWFLAVDIGYINHLRYMSKENIRSLICGRFGIIQMTSRVYKFLLNKFSCSTEQELFEVLNCRYLNITDGENGSKFVYKNADNAIEVKSKNAVYTQVIDPTGAGDAYFSMLLQQLNSEGYFSLGVEAALEKAGLYAANRVAVTGAHGIYKKIELPQGDCKVCGSIRKEKTVIKSSRQKIATNTNHLLDRTLRALESNAAQKLREVLNNIEGQILMVGTGGSFAAAEFAAKCVTQYHPNALAQACHPRDIVIRGLSKIDMVFLFSYSGKTKDIQSIYSFCQKEGVQVYIITKYENSGNIALYDQETLISYSSSKSSTKERGFISMAGTLIPMCIFGEIYYSNSNNSFIEFLKECFERRRNEFLNERYFFNLPDRKMIVDIFSGVDTSCAAIDLESKFIESGLARVVIHEKKDFSHGRFNILEKYTPDLIVFLDNIRGAYSDKLLRYLEKRENLYICHLVTTQGNIWGDLDLVIAAEFFSKYLSKVLDYDMAKPDYPEDAMALYRYSRKDLL